MHDWTICPKTARLAGGGHPDVFVAMWDDTWPAYAIITKPDAPLTHANLRGMIKRNLNAHSYLVELIETDMQLGCPARQRAVTFRFKRMRVQDLPKQKPIKIRAFVPPEPTEQHTLI